MTRWEACPQLCSASDCSQGKILLLICLLDGELTLALWASVPVHGAGSYASFGVPACALEDLPGNITDGHA